jgi:hypothetical protein
MQKRQWFIVIICLVLLGGFGGWQTVQLVKANQTANTLERAIALSAFKAQYATAWDKIQIQSVMDGKATIIYWTENVTDKDGKTILHGTAFADGTLFDSQTTRDVTEYLKK